ncbi:phage tail protein [Serratia nevei]|uniref:phage tail protein n=1 Tax=Serratia nevei TaxID=2703794 RepID=UPI00209CC1BD|nr:phage tail protein [Serratia nevei]MCP1106682.1 phage tail protein [Serratia nevei]
METQHHSILTTAGAEYFAQAIATGTPVVGIEFTLAVGDGGGQQYEPTEDQTALVGEQWRGTINDIFLNEHNAAQVVIEGIVPTNVGGWYIREWGVFNSNNVLIAVGSIDDTYKSLLTSGTGKQIIIQAILDIDNAAILELVVDDSIVIASKKYVDEMGVRIKDEVFTTLSGPNGAYLSGFHETTVGAYLDHLTQLVMHTTPEAHGAKGDGVTDDTVAWRNALAMNVHVICHPQKKYRVTSSVVRKYSDAKVTVEGNGCKIYFDHNDHAFLTDASNTENPSLYNPLGIYNTEFKNITAWNAATRMSKYGDVMRSSFARTFNGSVIGCHFTGFCDSVVMLGDSTYFDNYTTDCRDNALVIFGKNNRGGAIVGGVTGGDSVLCKSYEGVFGDISFEESGVLPLGHPDGDNTPGGSPLAFAQDGDNAVGNIFGNIRCKKHGSGGIIMNGENNYVHSVDSGSFVDESRTHLPAGGAWVVYMSGKNNRIGEVKADYYHNGVQMHDKSEGCHIGNVTLQKKSPYGQFTLVASGTQKNCSIGNVSAFENVNKNDEIYVAMPGIRIGKVTIGNFNSTYVAGLYVARILSRCYIDGIYISSAGDATHTRTALLISADATIKEIHQDNIIAVGVEVTPGAKPALGAVVVNQHPTLGINNPVILRGDAETENRTFMSLRVTGGAPRIEGGTVDIGTYIGQRWQGNSSAKVNYPILETHAPNT